MATSAVWDIMPTTAAEYRKSMRESVPVDSYGAGAQTASPGHSSETYGAYPFAATFSAGVAIVVTAGFCAIANGDPERRFYDGDHNDIGHRKSDASVKPGPRPWRFRSIPL